MQPSDRRTSITPTRHSFIDRESFHPLGGGLIFALTLSSKSSLVARPLGSSDLLQPREQSVEDIHNRMQSQELRIFRDIRKL